MGLYCWLALRGLWGFCVRVRLGGLEACCVFAPILSVFPLLCLRFSYSLSFYLCVCSACPLCLLCLSLWPCGLCRCFFFPFGSADKKKGRKVCSLRPLSSCCGCLYAFANSSRASCHTFSASSGFSPQLFQCWRLAP